MARTYTFTDRQHTQIIAALILAGLQYADPSLIIETLDVISPLSAATLREHLDRDLIDREREQGRAFGPVAEAARTRLAQGEAMGA